MRDDVILREPHTIIHAGVAPSRRHHRLAVTCVHHGVTRPTDDADTARPDEGEAVLCSNSTTNMKTLTNWKSPLIPSLNEMRLL